jgi:hypothetical protein
LDEGMPRWVATARAVASAESMTVRGWPRLVRVRRMAGSMSG